MAKSILAGILVVTFLFYGQQAFGDCLKCHRGIEAISDLSAMKELKCTFCHRGDAKAIKKEMAHKGMWANPSDFAVVEDTCGACHHEILEKVKKSLHATSAGIISATRYLFAAQKGKNAIYAVRSVMDSDGIVPAERGAVKELCELPFYDPSRPESATNTPADDYLREECLRCHLYSYGAERYGDYRSSGCAACHVIYDDDGVYKGGDAATKKKGSSGQAFSPRPKFHRITTRIPPFQCIHCHNRGGRTGVSFIGTMESDGYGSPWSGTAGEKGARKIHGKYYNHLQADVHYEKGLFCIDCHTERDVHGDGNIYSKKEQAVEIECQDCHGTTGKKSRLESSRGSRLRKLSRARDGVVLTSVTGKTYIVPQVKDILEEGPEKAGNAMGLSCHMEKMECYACHSRWAPQCYGCHAQQDTSTRSLDWLNTKGAGDPSRSGRAAFRKGTVFKWRETRSYLRWEDPVLGINSEGLVSPFIPGCQVIFTQIGPDGKCRIHNRVYKTRDGFSSIATNPIQPHTVTKRARSCENCHSNPKALGLGSGIYVTRDNGVDLPFELEKIVDKEGRQLQATSHYGARPFNREELAKITRVSTCAACHGWGFDALKGAGSSYNATIDNAMHKHIIQELLNKNN